MTSKFRRHLPYLVLMVFVLSLVTLSSNVQGEGATSGRYNISRNTTGVELETVTQSSCGRPQGSPGSSEGGCHLVNQTFAVDLYPYDGMIDYYAEVVPEGVGITHPSSDRDVAGFYPTWVHRRMGGTNWPSWETSVNSDTSPADDLGFFTTDGTFGKNQTEPWPARKSGQGYTDAEIGTAGTQSGINRTFWRLDTEPYDTGAGKVGDPTAVGPTRNQGLPGCTYGTQGGEPPSTNFSGCHGTYNSYNNYGVGGTELPRTDNISCTECHEDINVNSTSQIAGKGYGHGTGGSPGADDCYDCHSDNFGPTNPTTNNLSGLFLPKIVWCTECHDNTTNWDEINGKMGNRNFSEFLNPTFTHAGKDCRFCHGWGMNITRGDYWNGTNSSGQATSTCGNDDVICHGDSSTTRYVQPLTHGSQNYNVTCNDCHVNAGEPAHNITLPSCDKCHNSTGWSGETNDNSSTTAPVPSWNSRNYIYHGNSSRGAYGGKKCAECHIPNDITNLTKGYNLDGTPHNINTTQNNGKNYVPSCQEIVCHGNRTDEPIDPDGPAVNGTWVKESHASNVTNSTPLECTDCHNNETIDYFGAITINTNLHASYPSNIVPFDIQRGADGAVTNDACLNCHAFGALDCAACHSTDGVLIIHDADMNQPTAEIDGAHGAGGPNCVSCHDAGDPDNTITVNVSSMNNTDAMHYYLNNRTDDPGANITNGWVLAMTNCDNCINWNSQRCWACHSNGSQPANGTMGLNYTTPWKCWDCHVVNDTWVGERNSNFSWAPNVTEHIMEQYAPDIDTNTSPSTGKNGTCPICHANDMGITSGSIPKSGGLPASLLANVSHYGQNDSLMTSTVNSTECLYCHNDTDNASIWGNATQIFDDVNGMYQANESEDCWYCHTDNSKQPTNFHNQTLDIITTKCELCHFKYKYFNATQKTKFINETKYNESVHWNRSRIYCTDCHTNTSFGSARNETHPYQLEGATFLPPESGWRWCDDCHVYQAPYPNETQQRHNITSQPQNYYVINKTGQSQSVLDITDCTTCHNATYYDNAKATFNRASGKDCRWCHTFPELTPASPY